MPADLERRGMTVAAVDEFHTGRRRQQLDGLVARQIALELHVGGQCVTYIYGNPHTGGGGAQLGRMENLATLVHELPLLARVAGVLHRTGERNHVARDGTVPLIAGHRGIASGAGAAQALELARALGPLLVELAHAPLTGTGHGLVGGHDHALDAGGAMERRQRRDQDHGGAVGARHDPSGELA